MSRCDRQRVRRRGPELSVTLTDVGAHGFQATFTAVNQHGMGGGTAALGETPRDAVRNLSKKLGWSE